MFKSVRCIEVVVPMTKGSGDDFPDVSGLSTKEIKKIITLSVDTDTLMSFGFTHYKVIKDGIKSNTITIDDGEIVGYPTLQVRLYGPMGSVKVDFTKDAEPSECATNVTLGECFSYKVALAGDSQPFYFEDQNGYTTLAGIFNKSLDDINEFELKIAPKCIELKGA